MIFISLSSKIFCIDEDIFFSHVAAPLQDAWFLHKQGETDDAMSEVQNCIATDWATAGFDWLLRRAK